MIPGNALPSPTAFVAWTIPYVLGTFLINAVAPALLLGSVFRTPTIRADDITRANKVAVLAFAGADAYAVVVAWQGAWLQAVLAALGAVAWLPRHLIAPCAVAVVAAFEAWRVLDRNTIFDMMQALRETNDAMGDAVAAVISKVGTATEARVSKLQMEAFGEDLAAALEDGASAMETPFPRARCACVAAASLWLGAQAVATGSLSGCVGTAFAGIVAALWCTRAGRGAAEAAPPSA
jgi:hypothetical protein